MKVWLNMTLSEAALAALRRGLGAHSLVVSRHVTTNVHRPSERDEELLDADVAFGQPAPEDCLAAGRLRWIEVSTAGYTRYDSDEFLGALRRRGTVFTNASSVFADSCAQHAMAMMLALNRRLLASYRDQLTERPWHYDERRYESRRLTGTTVLLLGFGAIGRRLAELLAPYQCRLYALRRQARSEAGVRVVRVEELTAVLPLADHVVNLLPENEATRGFVNARRLACLKPGARFYNIGRGATVDQRALCEALESGRLGSAYLDVTTPEPLPPSDPLWEAPNCFITPHTAGGRHDQDDALVEHFLANLAAFEAGRPMTDRVA
ncbi:glyoxylate/hydroxypyruvate reductase A [mine drainage metagenome]|uniref:Glyoxylate/hydroxypyruvate reductase A n=1 Tax=mine drainage metagenome TaxID=410659 RepID=A0A1J5S5V7_9ZZZZ